MFQLGFPQRLIVLIIGIIIGIGDALALASESASFERIVNGEKTQISKHPYIVSVRRRSCNECAYEHYCGGTIFDELFIITAANCVRNVNSTDLIIVAGSSLRTGALQDGGILLPVHEIIIYHDKLIDLALIRLALKIPLNSTLKTKVVSLAKRMPKTGTLAAVAGWGRIKEDGEYSEELREAVVTILDLQQCQKISESLKLIHNEICAGPFGGGTDVCEGDAGGPLMVDGEMIGVTSWGVGCSRPGKPGVYTNVIKLGNWIVSQALGVHTAFL